MTVNATHGTRFPFFSFPGHGNDGRARRIPFHPVVRRVLSAVKPSQRHAATSFSPTRQQTIKGETPAETKKIKAQGEADANRVLNDSLTDNVLKQKYIDALSNAKNLTVVPDGSVPMIQTK